VFGGDDVLSGGVSGGAVVSPGNIGGRGGGDCCWCV